MGQSLWETFMWAGNYPLIHWRGSQSVHGQLQKQFNCLKLHFGPIWVHLSLIRLLPVWNFKLVVSWLWLSNRSRGWKQGWAAWILHIKVTYGRKRLACLRQMGTKSAYEHLHSSVIILLCLVCLNRTKTKQKNNNLWFHGGLCVWNYLQENVNFSFLRVEAN